MALDARLYVTGETQGEIEGSGEGGWIVIDGWAHEVIAPRDAASGLPTGKRQHKPLSVTKPIDRSTPLLMTLLTQNENVTNWTLEVYRTAVTGEVELYFTIELTNATVAGVRMESLNNSYAENAPHEPREHVSFTYQKITWTYADGGITAEDDWETPIA